jgi:hypothetical protein
VYLTGEIVGDGNMKGEYKVVKYNYKNKVRSFKSWHFYKGYEIGDWVPIMLDSTDPDEVIVVLNAVK